MTGLDRLDRSGGLTVEQQVGAGLTAIAALTLALWLLSPHPDAISVSDLSPEARRYYQDYANIYGLMPLSVAAGLISGVMLIIPWRGR